MGFGLDMVDLLQNRYSATEMDFAQPLFSSTQGKLIPVACDYSRIDFISSQPYYKRARSCGSLKLRTGPTGMIRVGLILAWLV